MSTADGSPLGDAYDRYARLITTQLEALDRGDLDALQSLASQRDRLAGEIDTLRASDRSGAVPEDALRRLESCLEADVRLRRRLEALQAELLRSAGKIDRDRIAVRVYAANTAARGTIDFSF